MKTMRYSKDVDAMLIELSDAPIAFAEEQESAIRSKIHCLIPSSLFLSVLVPLCFITSSF
ncbi:MAG: hypothetical protein ACRCT1_19140 [Microcoleaceae cyanobacterium]